jgi:small-conductance mechanosensitive channel
VLAVVVVAVAWYGSKLVVRLLSRRVARRFRRPSVVQTVLGSVRSPIVLLAIFVAAGVAGLLRIGDIVLSATVLTGATILVLTPIIGSVVNGLLILADQPYEIGDMIEFVDSTDRAQGGQCGFVENITLRYTKILTLDTTFIVVPNGTMRDRDVINYSAQDPRTRLSLDVLVTYEGDLEEARDLIERAAREAEVVVSGGPPIRIGAARYPAAPTCYINEFGDHGVLLTLRYWAREPYKLLTVRSAVQENVWAVLDDADVEMAYPHSHLVFDETSGTLPVSVDGDDRRFDDGEGRSDGERRPGNEGRPEDTQRARGRWQDRRAPPSRGDGSE